ncbi:hypothetical protein Q3G72_021350 [Acer saccharum]|nr:hypothetical protein Q3G72_021350 [Acer saccharum]
MTVNKLLLITAKTAATSGKKLHIIFHMKKDGLEMLSIAIKGTTIKAQPLYRQVHDTPLFNGFIDGKESSDESGRKPYIESKETPANGDGQLHAGSS